MKQMLTIPTVWPYFLFLFGLQWLITAIRERNNAKLLGTPYALFDIATACMATMMLWLRRSTRYALFLAFPVTALCAVLSLGLYLLGHEKEAISALDVALMAGFGGWLLELLSSMIEEI
ncbi:hypothetical protein [Gluconobacter sp. Dm-62]|uniref:hypothetical protein n=1 Tax=Gluconobacter sp. Dm-62 TaxID=2799804 RepID=UPI00201114E5|nr:hypothetical protein [Gluconobacter sp. Dm-62]